MTPHNQVPSTEFERTFRLHKIKVFLKLSKHFKQARLWGTHPAAFKISWRFPFLQSLVPGGFWNLIFSTRIGSYKSLLILLTGGTKKLYHVIFNAFRYIWRLYYYVLSFIFTTLFLKCRRGKGWNWDFEYYYRHCFHLVLLVFKMST